MKLVKKLVDVINDAPCIILLLFISIFGDV